MPFNLKKVLKALLLSSNQPLAIKDIQAAFTRFHEIGLPVVTAAGGEPAPAEDTGAGLPAGDGAEVTEQRPQLVKDVLSWLDQYLGRVNE